MTKQDIEKLFNLLDQLYQGKKKSRDEVTIAVWYEVLKLWSYEQVRDAAIQRARENCYSPDPSELAAYLPKSVCRSVPVNRHAPPTLSEERSMEKLLEWQAQWHEELKEMGLPTLKEALADGMTPGKWSRMLVAAGAFGADYEEDSHRG